MDITVNTCRNARLSWNAMKSLLKNVQLLVDTSQIELGTDICSLCTHPSILSSPPLPLLASPLSLAACGELGHVTHFTLPSMFQLLLHCPPNSFVFSSLTYLVRQGVCPYSICSKSGSSSSTPPFNPCRKTPLRQDGRRPIHRLRVRHRH